MAKKPAADLASAGLTVTKGAAMAPQDVAQRSAGIEALLPAPKPAPKAPEGGPLVPLQFRVPEDLREEFERYAFESQPRRKMVDVLKAAFVALKEREGRA